MTRALIIIRKFVLIILCTHTVSAQNEKEFSKGWEDGYEEGYCSYNLLHNKAKPVFITPIAPIASIGYDTYQEGYRLGVAQGKSHFMKQCKNCDTENVNNATLISSSNDGTFKEGWEAGYSDGYCEYNLLNNKMKPLFNIPISPIPPIGYDTYRSGYTKGVQKGREDFQKKH